MTTKKANKRYRILPNLHTAPEVPTSATGLPYRNGDVFARVVLGTKYARILRVNGPEAGRVTLVKLRHFAGALSPWRVSTVKAIKAREVTA